MPLVATRLVKFMLQRYPLRFRVLGTNVIIGINKNHFPVVILAIMSISNIFPLEEFEFDTARLSEHLDAKAEEILFRNKVVQQYKKGDAVFRDGSYAAGIYLVQSGLVKKYKIDNLGYEQIFYLYGTGEFFGYHAILSGKNFTDSTVCISDATLIFIPRQDFTEVLENYPAFSRNLLHILSHEFDVLANSLTLHNQRSLRERLIITLITLREKFKPADYSEGDPVAIRITRYDLASMLGTAKESVVRLLRDLKDEGLIITNGNVIELTDVRALLKIVNY